ncbi:MAG TPA: DNA primase small subunit PriS [Thermoplasmata archaeon]|nr:DNA primase small subunit PriS [Thermoplasmata archaeon]
MAKTLPLDASALDWARAVFADYYGRARVPPPDRLTRREFAAFPFAAETLMRRHATLRTPEELGAFLAREVPRHVYYSSAYYRRPAEPTMAAKEWLGADLIFDLDSDHLKGAERLDYAGQLELVKHRLAALFDDFLVRDFGVDPGATSLVFSGGRGYHVHVRDERFLPLSSPERRELVDYVLGTGVEPMRAVTSEPAGPAEPDGAAPEGGPPSRRRRAASRHLVPPDAPGWSGRTTRAVLEVLSRWDGAGAEVAEREMIEDGVPPRAAKKWAKLLVTDGGGRKIRRTLSLDVFPKEVPEELLGAVVRRATIEVQGETDAPVTTDIHRLIRLPGSLHGGTGFRVVPLERDALEEFDPFRDALLAAPDEGRTPITFTEAVRYPFAGGLRGEPGSTDELPTPVALFLVLRQEATLRS